MEEVAIGAQGHGLVTDYYGAGAADIDQAMGSYLAVTRRGSAVTLLAAEGGETLVGTVREDIQARLALAWERLCSYDSAGC